MSKSAQPADTIAPVVGASPVMPLEQAAAGFAAMGSDARLAVLRLLVRAGHAGRTVGQLQSALDLPASTLAHHLRTLAVAGLVTQEKRGRSVINRGAFDHLERLGQFVLAECCHDQQAAPRIVDTRDEEHKDVER